MRMRVCELVGVSVFLQSSVALDCVGLENGRRAVQLDVVIMHPIVCRDH